MRRYLALTLVACSSSSAVDAPATPGPDAARTADASQPGTPDAAAQPGTPDAAPPPATPDAPSTTTYTLTINNFDGWCTVTEDGVAFSPSKSFAAGTVVHLTAAPLNNTFVWGYWTGTDGGSHDTSMATTVTMNADAHVLACCPIKPPASQFCL